MKYFKNKKHLIILTQSRSGSNFLLDIINQHPSILNHGEIFWPGTYYYCISKIFEFLHIPMYNYLKWILNSRLLLLFKIIRMNLRKNYIKKNFRGIEIVGIKEFCTKFDQHNLFEWLHRNNDTMVIYLYRNNQLDRHVSLCNTRMTKKFVVTKEEKYTPNKVTIDIKYMIERLKLFEQQREIERREIEKYSGPKIYLNYEEYFFDEESIRCHNRKIFSFLGVRDFNAQIRQTKILPKSFSSKIDNYAEVINALKGTRFEKYLT